MTHVFPGRPSTSRRGPSIGEVAIGVRRTTRKARPVAGHAWLVDFLRRPGMLAEPLAELFELTAAGELRPVIGGEYGLSEVAEAHRALRSRSTVGKLLLDPSR